MKEDQKKSPLSEIESEKQTKSTKESKTAPNTALDSNQKSQFQGKSLHSEVSASSIKLNSANQVPIPVAKKLSRHKKITNSTIGNKKLILDTNVKPNNRLKQVTGSVKPVQSANKSEKPRLMTLFSGETSLIKQASASQSRKSKRNDLSSKEITSGNGMRKKLKHSKDVHWKDGDLEQVFMVETEFTGPKQRQNEIDDKCAANSMYNELSLENQWYEPKPYYFVKFDSDHSQTALKRGGYKHPVSPESERQKERERRSLVVFYSSADEIPKSPAEPPIETSSSGPKEPTNIPLSDEATEALKLFVSQALQANN